MPDSNAKKNERYRVRRGLPLDTPVRSYPSHYKSETDKFHRLRHTKAKENARRRGMTFTLSVEEYNTLRDSPCTYCCGPITSKAGGLDRIDNSRGYEIGNVLPCCCACNQIRGHNLTVDETKVAMAAVLAFRKQK